MATRRYRKLRTHRNKSKKMRGGKKWTTAIQAADKTYTKTGSINAAKKSLRKQALSNARKLFGSI
jgi:CMP-N-acetylneuraminic acid synthetase